MADETADTLPVSHELQGSGFDPGAVGHELQGRAAEPQPEPLTAADRLRAFEDEKLGADIHRIDGRIERGYGSFFKTKLTDEDRAHHALLEKLVEAEAKLEAAKSALGLAEVEYAEAEIAVNNA